MLWSCWNSQKRFLFIFVGKQLCVFCLSHVFWILKQVQSFFLHTIRQNWKIIFVKLDIFQESANRIAMIFAQIICKTRNRLAYFCGTYFDRPTKFKKIWHCSQYNISKDFFIFVLFFFYNYALTFLVSRTVDNRSFKCILKYVLILSWLKIQGFYLI